MGFNPNDYEDVDTRIHKFYDKHPEGRIKTELVQTAANKGERWIVRALVYRTATDELCAGTGYAFEVDGQGNVNTTSALENCETSAIGRALANIGFSAKGARASREEMTKANRGSNGARAEGTRTVEEVGAPSSPDPASSGPLAQKILEEHSWPRVKEAWIAVASPSTASIASFKELPAETLALVKQKVAS